MFAAGWVGLVSGWLSHADDRPRAETLMPVIWDLIIGLAYGALMNIYFWPYVFASSAADMYLQPGVGVIETLRRF
jgi:energy-coupling factor transport system substrate-specific component